QVADADDLDVLRSVVRGFGNVVGGAAILRHRSGTVGRTAQGIDSAPQRFDHALLGIELRFELADQILLSDELRAKPPVRVLELAISRVAAIELGPGLVPAAAQALDLAVGLLGPVRGPGWCGRLL